MNTDTRMGTDPTTTMVIATAVAEAPASLTLLRLCQLVSPALPIGAYNFSQGIEFAVHAGWVHDEASASEWIGGLAVHSVGTLDLPLLARLCAAWSAGNTPAARRWSASLLAARDNEEQRAEERHLGRSLAKVLISQGIEAASEWTSSVDATHACLFALAAAHWGIPAEDAAQGYLWSWCENQILAALKLLPLGQTAGLRIQGALLPLLPGIVRASRQITADDIGVATPLQGMACAWHETQYTRLFRS